MKKAFLTLLAVLIAASAFAMPMLTTEAVTVPTPASPKIVWFNPGAGVECLASQTFQRGTEFQAAISFEPIGVMVPVPSTPLGSLTFASLLTASSTKTGPKVGMDIHFGPYVVVGPVTDFKNAFLYVDLKAGAEGIGRFLGWSLGQTTP
jgi:hypothetical protein